MSADTVTRRRDVSRDPSDHADHYVIPAIDTGVRPVGEHEVYCTDCHVIYDDPGGASLSA